MGRFKLHDVVVVREDLKIGKIYYNENSPIGDNFSIGMMDYIGKEAKIIRINSNGGYMLDIDPIYSFYDEMLRYPYEVSDEPTELDTEPYMGNMEVEMLVEHMKSVHYKKLIDKALDERMHEKEPQQFKELYELYKIYVKN